MRTDDRTTGHEDTADREEAKVVRLSDWLGPIDELVPFGPRADAQHAASHPSAGHTGDELGGASGFWDGDTSVHTAVPAPGTLGPSTADAPARVTTTSGWFARTRETLLVAVANRFSRLELEGRAGRSGRARRRGGAVRRTRVRVQRSPDPYDAGASARPGPRRR